MDNYILTNADHSVTLMPFLHAVSTEQEKYETTKKFVSPEIGGRNSALGLSIDMVSQNESNIRAVVIESAANVSTFYLAMLCKSRDITLNICPFSWNVTWNFHRRDKLFIEPFGDLFKDVIPSGRWGNLTAFMLDGCETVVSILDSISPSMEMLRTNKKSVWSVSFCGRVMPTLVKVKRREAKGKIFSPFVKLILEKNYFETGGDTSLWMQQFCVAAALRLGFNAEMVWSSSCHGAIGTLIFVMTPTKLHFEPLRISSSNNDFSVFALFWGKMKPAVLTKPVLRYVNTVGRNILEYMNSHKVSEQHIGMFTSVLFTINHCCKVEQHGWKFCNNWQQNNVERTFVNQWNCDNITTVIAVQKGGEIQKDVVPKLAELVADDMDTSASDNDEEDNEEDDQVEWFSLQNCKTIHCGDCKAVLAHGNKSKNYDIGGTETRCGHCLNQFADYIQSGNESDSDLECEDMDLEEKVENAGFSRYYYVPGKFDYSTKYHREKTCRMLNLRTGNIEGVQKKWMTAKHDELCKNCCEEVKTKKRNRNVIEPVRFSKKHAQSDE